MNISALMWKKAALSSQFNNKSFPIILSIKQMIRISASILILVFTTIYVLLASPVKSQDIAAVQVTLGMNNEPFSTAIKKIEQQTSLRFYYRKSEIKTINNLNLPLANRTVEQVLYLLLKNTSLGFRQVEKSILIEDKGKAFVASKKITGVVQDEKSQKPVDFALVELLRKSDSTLVGHGYTDTTGRYSVITEESAEIKIRISKMGYVVYSGAVPMEDNDIIVPLIHLQPRSVQLKEVNVSSTEPMIQRKADRFVVSIGNNSLSQGNNVWDVLEKIPLINATETGSLSIIGKQSAVVYINGRKSNLTGESLFNYLKGLPASILANIEIITSPGAEYDASGNSGIINIIFKKRETDGYQASFGLSYVQSFYNQQGASGSVSYRNGKLGVNFTSAYSRITQLVTENHTTDFMGLKNNGLLEISDNFWHQLKNFSGQSLGLEYNMTDKQTLSVTGNYNTDIEALNDLSNSQYSTRSNQQQIDSALVSTTSRKVNGHSLDAGINYNVKLDTLGQNLTIGGDYFNYINNGTQYNYATQSETNSVRQNELSILPQKINNYTFAIDYKYPFNKATLIKAGARSNNTYTNNNLYYATGNTAGVFTKDTARTTNYNYQEHVNALYLSVANTWSRSINTVAGMRLEQSNINGEELIHQQVGINKNYLNLFPNIVFNYTPDKDHQFSYTVSERIRRPAFWELNPFRTYLSPSAYAEGNPFLQPSHILINEFSFSLHSKYIFLATYSHTSNLSAQFLLANDSTNILRYTRLNFGALEDASIAFLYNAAISKIFQTSLTITGEYTRYHGATPDGPIDNSGISGEIKLNNTIFISRKKGWTGYLFADYNTRQIDQYNSPSAVHAWGTLNMGVRKVIGKFNITLYGSDLLKTSASVTDSYSTYTFQHSRNYYDTQNVTLSARYSFGNSKLKKNQQQENPAGDVINRAGH